MAPNMFLFERSRFIIAVVLLCALRQSTQACNDNAFQCDEGRCISEDRVCDYFDDCTDRSDERNCTYPTPDFSKVLVCIANSHKTGRSTLHKLYGNPDNYAHKFGNDAFAKKLPIHLNWLHFRWYGYLHYLSIDYNVRKVHFSNDKDKRLEYGYFIHNISTRAHPHVAAPETNEINGVAIDWVTKNIYWTDGVNKIIGVLPSAASVRVPIWKEIVDRNLSSPQDIAVNPILHYLFWSDGTGSNAKIERSDLSGNNRTVLLSSTQGLVSPTTLVVDFSSQKLYWLDSAAETIGSINFDGSQRFAQTISGLRGVSAMTVYMDYVFFGHKEESIIYIFEKTSMNNISWYRLPGSGGITDMAMFASDVQPSATNLCAMNNGGCSQFCWTRSPVLKACDCAVGFFLASDEAKCISRPLPPNDDYLIVCDFILRNIYQLKLDSPDVRAISVNLCHPASLAFDPSTNDLYMTCWEEIHDSGGQHEYLIRKITFDGKTNQVLYHAPPYSELLGLALDTKRNLLYYTDVLGGVIGEMKTDGSNRRELLNDRSKHPRAIVVDSINRRIYWSDNSGTATIQTARVEDVGDRRTIITDNGHQSIVDIFIDFDNEMMYWASLENPAVKMASLHGTGQVTLLNESKADYTGITLYDNFLYISDQSRRNIIKIDLKTRAVSLQEPGLFSSAHDVTYKSTGTATGTTTSPESESESESDQPNWVLIVAIAASVGGVIVIVVVITVVLQVCALCRRPRRPIQSTPEETATVAIIPMSALTMLDDTQGAAGGVKDAPMGYEILQSGNIYDSVMEMPPISARNRMPLPTEKPPVKPKPQMDLEGYLVASQRP